ncbi:MAG: hypothetical protein HZB59_08320 [Ignavibacteriales bacterium]|nr:hypothetical protein [Ignavibacteriales bacterium]
MKIKPFIMLTIIFLLAAFSCKETPPEPGNGTVTNGMLTVEDVGVTDAVLRLRLPGGLMNRTITLKRQNTKQQNDTATIYNSRPTTNHSPIDTLIIDERLLPKQSYRYTLTVENFFHIKERSYADIITMDTTNHNFTWQIDTLGDGNSSVLYDVAIVNDTCIIAVGEINIQDSLGNWIRPPYNLARWNGKKWNLKRVMYNYQGTDYYSQLYSIFVFDENNYWVGSNQPMHWIGNKWETFDLGSKIWNGLINKIWGSSSSNIYIVGNQGALAHFDGTSWQKIESGTEVNLTDVWGSPDGKAVWACGYFNNKRGTYLLRKNTSNWEVAYDGTPTEFSLLSDTLSGALTSVYTPSSRYIYVCSHFGLYRASANTRGEAKRYSFTSSTFPGFPRGMRGNGINDITIAGDYTMIARWNGYTWRYYDDLRNLKIHFNAVAQKGNLIVAVGVLTDPIHGKGIAYIGRRR